MHQLEEKTVAVQKAFERELNQHGYGFQHAVIARVRGLYNGDHSWCPMGAELPVDQGPGTKVDIILRSSTFHTSVWLVGECKRVNPAFTDWCFISSPFTHDRRRRGWDSMSLECLNYDPLQPIDNPTAHIKQTNGMKLEKAYHIGLAIKSAVSGDVEPRAGTGRDAIEAAASQVLRGLNGFVNTLVTFPDMLTFEKVNVLLPVIFTTAKLWVSSADLSTADLESGNVALEQHKFEQANWIWFQYHTSTGLKHPHVIESDIVANFEHLMDSEYIRTIAIVSATGLDQFLIWSAGRDLLSGFAEA